MTNAIAVSLSKGQRIFFLCLLCGIFLFALRPLNLEAKALPTPASLNPNENKTLTPINWDGLDADSAQQSSQPETPVVSTKPETTSSNPQAGVAASPSLVSPQTTAKDKKKSSRGALVPAPLPIVSPAIGKGIIPGLGYIFPFSKNDKVSPPSVVGAAGMFTNNGSRGFGVGADLYMKEDTYEITAMY